MKVLTDSLHSSPLIRRLTGESTTGVESVRCLVLSRKKVIAGSDVTIFRDKGNRIMKSWFSSILFLVFIVANTSSTIAQDKAEPAVKDFSSLIDQVFAPITDKLNLTQEQQFQIVAIITETEVRADPLLRSLAVADQELSEFSFFGVPDGNRLKEVCDQQAAILSEIMQLKVRAKAEIVRVLTTEQRAIVARQFKIKLTLKDAWNQPR